MKIAVDTRVCTKCDKKKVVADFARGAGGRPRRICKRCKADQTNAWRAANPDKVGEHNRRKRNGSGDRVRRAEYRARVAATPEGRRAHLNYQLKRYGITADEYDEMLSIQGGHCALCPSRPGKRRLAVDHCHATGRVRGLLCAGCNTSLGRLGDGPDAIRRVLAYVEV